MEVPARTQSIHRRRRTRSGRGNSKVFAIPPTSATHSTKKGRATIGLATGRDAMIARYQIGTEVRPTLADAGIDKKLSASSQKLAKFSTESVETKVAEWRQRAEQSGGRISALLAGSRNATSRDSKAKRFESRLYWGNWGEPDRYTGGGWVPAPVSSVFGRAFKPVTVTLPEGRQRLTRTCPK
jgi:hypothetical protein